jgi:hypothetical protein
VIDDEIEADLGQRKPKLSGGAAIITGSATDARVTALRTAAATKIGRPVQRLSTPRAVP